MKKLALVLVVRRCVGSCKPPRQGPLLRRARARRSRVSRRRRPTPTPPTAAGRARGSTCLAQCRAPLDVRRRRHRAILDGEGGAPSTNTLEPFNEAVAPSQQRRRVGAPARGRCTPTRRSATPRARASRRSQKFYSRSAARPRVYDALKARRRLRSPTRTRKRFVDDTLRDYRRAGVELADARRATRIKQIDEELTRARPAVLEEHRRGRARRSRSRTRRGSPACRPTSSRRTSPTRAASIRITTDYPDYNPFMTYADDDELRQASSTSSSAAAATQQNEAVLQRDPDAARREGVAARLQGLGRLHHRRQDDAVAASARAASSSSRSGSSRRRAPSRTTPSCSRSCSTIDPKATAVADWQKVVAREPGQEASATRSTRARCASTSRTSACSPACSTITSRDLRHPVRAGRPTRSAWHADVQGRST